MFISKEKVEELRREYPAGCRVGLLHMDDTQAPPPATCGTVRGVDDAGQIMVHWDTGSSLSLAPGIDEFRRI